MAFSWAKPYPDLQLICRAFGLYELEDPLRFHYRPLQGMIQEGPQCGLTALAMCANRPTKEHVRELFEYARLEGFTNNGELFSVDYMHELARQFLDDKTEVYEGALDTEEVTEFLLRGGMMLVPYDCDRNHTPCLMKGHKAHWAVVSGVVETDFEVFVVAKHGKSLNTAVWSLSDVARSNGQLVEFAPDRKGSGVAYVLPDGGIDGPRGLCNRSVLIHPSSVGHS